MEDPEQYSRNSGDSLKDAKIVLEEFREWFQESDPERILDVGCGSGDVTVLALQAFFRRARVFGCDESKSMIDYANRKYSYTNVFFELVDLSNGGVWEKWEEGSFSKIFSFYAMHRINNKRTLAETVYKLLSPGGQILFITPIENPVYQVFKKLLGMEKYHSIHERLKQILEHVLEIEDPCTTFTTMLTECNFTDIHCVMIDSSFHYPSLESYLNLLKAYLPSTVIVKGFEEDCVKFLTQEKLIDISPTGLDYNYKYLIARATKNNI